MKTEGKKAGITVIILALLFLPPVATIGAKSNSRLLQQDTTVISSINLSGVHSFKASDGVSTYAFKYRGKIRVADDDRSIESISPGGYLSITKITFGNRRSIKIDSDIRGNLQYEYFEGRNELSYEPAGREWLEDVLLDVIRMTGIDAEGRARRMYTGSGTDRVLEEIDQIRSNHVKGTYFQVLLTIGELSNEELSKVAIEIANSISSNSERGNIYRKFSDRFLNDDRVAAAYFKGVSRLSSNSEIGSVLRNAIRNHDLTDPQYVSALYTATRMTSNSERGSVLRSIEHLNFDHPNMTDAYFGVIKSMSSSSEIGSALRKLIENQDLEDDVLVILFDNLKQVSSSTEKGSVLRSMDDIRLTDKEVILGYFGVVNSISSNSEKGSVLRKLLNAQPQNKACLVGIFITTKQIDSNSEKGSVLRSSIQWLGEQDEKVMTAFFESLNTISSSTEQGQVLRDLIGNLDLETRTQIMILESAARISSNSEKALVLVKLAEKADMDNEMIKNTFFETARTISSDSEYRRVMDKIYNK